jgi:hypothetical protein
MIIINDWNYPLYSSKPYPYIFPFRMLNNEYTKGDYLFEK